MRRRRRQRSLNLNEFTEELKVDMEGEVPPAE
jgi:hypothetical protein